jgi:alkylation response protein AidB-like acyl-CoA dehydrogenase
MDFELSDDQVALVDGVRSFLDGRFSIEAVRAMIDTGLDRARWGELAEMGVFSLALPEAAGGVGLTWADSTLVFEQLGRSLVPGPLVATTLAAMVSPAAASGDEIVTAVERADGAVVEHLDVVDRVLVIDDDGLWALDPASLAATPEPKPLDPLTPVHRTAGLPQGDQVGDAALSAEMRTIGAVLTSALQLGLAGRGLELAVAYAKEREQFGKPIGSFQAVKHLCADMVSRLEVARAAVYFAGVCLDDPVVGDRKTAASVARILASEAASANGKDCIQVHGGMGYTWEVDAHLLLKRAWVLAASFGTTDEHARRLAATLA